MFHRDIQTPRREFKIPRAVEYSGEIRGVSIVDDTLPRVYELSTPSKQKLTSK